MKLNLNLYAPADSLFSTVHYPGNYSIDWKLSLICINYPKTISVHVLFPFGSKLAWEYFKCVSALEVHLLNPLKLLWTKLLWTNLLMGWVLVLYANNIFPKFLMIFSFAQNKFFFLQNLMDTMKKNKSISWNNKLHFYPVKVVNLQKKKIQCV